MAQGFPAAATEVAATPPAIGVHAAEAAGDVAGTAPEDAGMRLLDPTRLRLRRGPTGVLRATLPDRSYLQVAVYRAFPLTDADEWFVLLDGADHEVGVLRSLEGLDPESAALVREELELRYLVPHVREIVRICEDRLEGGHWRPGLIWDLQTDRGPRRVRMSSLSDGVRPLGPGRLLLLDRDGGRCEIADVEALSPSSRRWLQRYLWM